MSPSISTILLQQNSVISSDYVWLSFNLTTMQSKLLALESNQSSTRLLQVILVIKVAGVSVPFIINIFHNSMSLYQTYLLLCIVMIGC